MISVQCCGSPGEFDEGGASRPSDIAVDAVQLERGATGLRVAMVALAGFGAIYAAVRANRTAAIDLAITLRIQGRRSPGVTRVMAWASWPGFPPQNRVIVPLIAGGLWMRGHRREAGFQLAAWSTAVLSTIVKSVTRRPRPLPTQVAVVMVPLGGSSFPSGHVLTYVGVYGFAAYLAESLVERPAPRRLLVGGLVGLVALVGPSRIYQGHHWPTDVAASYLLGLSALIGVTTAYRRLKRRRVIS